MKRISSLIFVFMFMLGCNNDYKHQLPNGYYLTHIYSGSLAIANQNHRVIVGPSKYGIVIGIKDDYIVGNLDTEEIAFGVQDVPDKYFIVNTKSGTVESDLPSSVFHNRIKHLGLGEIVLNRPSKSGYN